MFYNLIKLVVFSAYTAKPIVPAENAELISVAEAMHGEKFGERLQNMFAPETEAAIKAMESGSRFVLVLCLFCACLFLT